jgi:hypothetical protein
MSRRLPFVALCLAVLAPACARPVTPPPVEFGAGTQFVSFVADSADDVGGGSSIAVSPDGTPYVSYFGFAAELKPGEIVPARPVAAPTLPSVDLTGAKDGIWTRGAVAIQAQIPNVTVAFGPAVVGDVASMTPQNVNGTAMAMDASGGIHVVWASDTGVWYAMGTGTAFTASQVSKIEPPLSTAGPLGAPSIAIDKAGTPWVAYTVASAVGLQVMVATPKGERWQAEAVATIPLAAGAGTQPSRTAIAVTGDGTPVVVFSDGADVVAAMPTSTPSVGSAPAWVQTPVERGGLGAGLSATTAPDGTVVVAYHTASEIHVALTSDGRTWTVSSVAEAALPSGTAGASTGVAVDANSTLYVTWYDPATDSVVLVSGTGQSFTPIATPGTKGGNQPSLAVGSDGTVYMAWYDRTNQNLMLGGYGEASNLQLAVQSPTPTGPPSPPAPPPSQACAEVKNGEVTIVAQGIAFLTTCIEVDPDTAFTIHFENKDAGTQHNIEIFNSTDASGDLLMQGDIITGPATADYQVDPLSKGEYFFNCVVHPTMMTGKVVVK